MIDCYVKSIDIRSCASDEATAKDKELKKELDKGRKADNAVKKLLFLGSGGSGKSTLFKQLRSLHGSGFGDKDRLQFKDHIYAQITEQMKLVMVYIDIYNADNEEEKDLELSAAGARARDKLLAHASSSPVWCFLFLHFRLLYLLHGLHQWVLSFFCIFAMITIQPTAPLFDSVYLLLTVQPSIRRDY